MSNCDAENDKPVKNGSLISKNDQDKPENNNINGVIPKAGSHRLSKNNINDSESRNCQKNGQTKVEPDSKLINDRINDNGNSSGGFSHIGSNTHQTNASDELGRINNHLTLNRKLIKLNYEIKYLKDELKRAHKNIESHKLELEDEKSLRVIQEEKLETFKEENLKLSSKSNKFAVWKDLFQKIFWFLILYFLKNYIVSTIILVPLILYFVHKMSVGKPINAPELILIPLLMIIQSCLDSSTVFYSIFNFFYTKYMGNSLFSYNSINE